MKIYIHIGYPKNASTTLQTDIFPNIKGLLYLGRRYQDKQAYQTKELSDALYDVAMKDSIDFSEELNIRRIRLTLDDIGNRFNKVLISSEAFSNNVADRGLIAHRLKVIFPDAKIIIIIRNQVDALKSMYTFLCAQLGKNINLSYGRPSVQSFDQWINEQESFFPRSYINTLKYDQLIFKYKTLFGKENVKTLLYEHLKKSPSQFFSEIEDFVEAKIKFNSDPQFVPSRNKSPTRNALIYYKLRQKFPNIVPSKYFPSFMTKSWHKILFSNNKGSSEYFISNAIEDRILSYYHESNRRLQKDFDINLEKLGYCQKAKF